MGLLTTLPSTVKLDETVKLRIEYMSYAKAYMSETGQTMKQFNEHTESLLMLYAVTDPKPRDWVNAAIEVWTKFTENDDGIDVDGMGGEW
jgi:hypothetical protein